MTAIVSILTVDACYCSCLCVRTVCRDRDSVTAGPQGRMCCSVEAVAGSVLEQYSNIPCLIISHVIDVEKLLSH